jgi:hypothetical protein
MKKLKSDEQGFIPMIIALVLLILIAVVIAYLRVKKAQQ